MTIRTQTHAALAALAALATTAPAEAQWPANLGEPDPVGDIVNFFERAKVGAVDVTPVGVMRDTRGADSGFAKPRPTLIIAAVLHTQGAASEIELELNRPTVVPGGFLVLRGAGTQPNPGGAIALEDYSLDLEFIPGPVPSSTKH
ncbi:MAG: hypothetical protein AAFZ11_03910 [Pseudomonadota bacterium]